MRAYIFFILFALLPGLANADCDPEIAPGYQAPPGCSCKDNWAYQGRTFCDASCANPDNDSNGPWCFTEGLCNGGTIAYCVEQTTCDSSEFKDTHFPPPECRCKTNWNFNDKNYCEGECANPDNDPNGPWCFTEGVCNGSNFTYCAEQVTCDSSEYKDTHLPPPGCSCKTHWTFNGKTYCEGECANPDNDPNGPWCFTEGTCNGANVAYCQEIVADTCEPGEQRGDADLDCCVTGLDLDILRANFGEARGVDETHGDFDGDGVVSGNDFLIWQRTLGSCAPTPTPVPTRTPTPLPISNEPDTKEEKKEEISSFKEILSPKNDDLLAETPAEQISACFVFPKKRGVRRKRFFAVIKDDTGNDVFVKRLRRKKDKCITYMPEKPGNYKIFLKRRKVGR